jgi:hypothetical protein
MAVPVHRGFVLFAILSTKDLPPGRKRVLQALISGIRAAIRPVPWQPREPEV